MNVEKIIETLVREHDAEIHWPPTEKEIKIAQRILQLRFPASYLAYLRKAGWMRDGADTIYGLGPDCTEATNVVDRATFESVEADPPMFSRLVPLMPDGFGNHDCLNTELAKDGDAPVVLWQHDDPKGELQKPKVVAKTFTKWLQSLAER